MFVKNSLMGIDYCSFIEKNKELVNVFNSAINNGLLELTIPYLLKNTHIQQLELYDNIHELLEFNILEIKEYSICPHCTNQDVYKETDMVRCSKCKHVYSTNNIIEKFKLVNKDK
ncbi:MAG: hypothetical protein LLF98_06415 [Clostridium sp.]|uniref:hypothetical protein n=1 Tax=Clostridium sp. TaxID=1506 RepID=UPI0025BD069F|nr:hypothetical protein [Clostridium sp.]MCE5220899.1 hypothetical protein [Clostridium sp.]